MAILAPGMHVRAPRRRDWPWFPVDIWWDGWSQWYPGFRINMDGFLMGVQSHSQFLTWESLLLGGSEQSFFHILGIITPTDENIFQRGRSTTSQIRKCQVCKRPRVGWRSTDTENRCLGPPLFLHRHLPLFLPACSSNEFLCRNHQIEKVWKGSIYYFLRRTSLSYLLGGCYIYGYLMLFKTS